MNFTPAHFSAVLAFSLWGFFPIYWKIFKDVAPWDLFAHRTVFSFITLMLILLYRKRFSLLKGIWVDPRKRFMLFISAGLISSNWLLYIYAVNTGKILEASMGYFLNPLINVFMGRIILKEKMRGTQWPAVLLALSAMVLIAVQADIKQVPWLALILAITFALYGLIRKMVHVSSMEGLTYETSVMVPFIMMAWFFHETGPMTAFQILPIGKIVILGLSGLVTCLPLVLFAFSAKNLSLRTLGFTQYLSPSLKFICGYFIYNETLSSERLQAFVIIWLALAWYTIESFYFMRKARRK